MDNLKEALQKWLNFRPDKRGPPQDVEIEPLVLEDEHEEELYFVVGMGEHDGMAGQ